jgi:dipeptidyl aminopeptidase/acylaminoacyl peptidase
LTTPDPSRGEQFHRWPQTLPGGWFLFSVRSGKPETSGIYAASSAKPGERKLLLHGDTNAVYAPGGDGKDYLLWMRSGTLVAQEFNRFKLQLTGEPRVLVDPLSANGSLGNMNVGASAGGVLLYSPSNTLGQFAWFDRSGKPLGLSGEPGAYSMFRLSPDRRRIAVAQNSAQGMDIWLLDVERPASSRLTLNSVTRSYPTWSPDGRSILFGAGYPRNLFRADSSGAGDEQRTAESPNYRYPSDWSRDGHWLLFSEITSETGLDLWFVPVTAEGRLALGATPKPFARTPFNENWGRFSPESPPHWVAYQSDATGRFEIYIQAFPEPRGKFQISTAGGRFPQWGAGGRELFYLSPENKLMVVNLKLGADSVEPSAPRELFPLPVADIGYSPYDATPDGQRFLVRAVPQKASEPLTVIINWPAVLKKEPATQ